MTQLSSLERYKLPFLYLPGDNNRSVAQRVRRRKEADLKQLQNKVMNILVMQLIVSS